MLGRLAAHSALSLPLQGSQEPPSQPAPPLPLGFPGWKELTPGTHSWAAEPALLLSRSPRLPAAEGKCTKKAQMVLAGRGGDGARAGAGAGHWECGQAEPPCRAGWRGRRGLLLGRSARVGAPLSESGHRHWTRGPDARPQGPCCPGGGEEGGAEAKSRVARWGVAPWGRGSVGAWLPRSSSFLLPFLPHPPALYLRALLAGPASCLRLLAGVVLLSPPPSLLPTSPHPTPPPFPFTVWFGPNFCFSWLLAPCSCSSDIETWSGTRLLPSSFRPSALWLTPRFLETSAAL